MLLYNSPLEQFLLLDDNFNLISIILYGASKFLYISSLFGANYDTEIFGFYNQIYFEKYLFNEIYYNFYFTIINLQYYKLSLFLIIVLTALSNYNIKLIPSSVWQYISQQSHIVAQSILKPTFGAHYPFEIRFYNYYPLFYFIFLFILCNNLLGLIPYGFSNSAFIVHNFTLSFLFLSGLTFIVFLFKEFIIINYLFLKIYQLI